MAADGGDLEDPGKDAPAPSSKGLAAVASQKYPFNEPFETSRSSAGSPANHYASLSSGECRAEVRRRKLPVEPVGGASSGIAAPLRISGLFHGVRFITPNKKTPWGKVDCRMVLALDDLSAVLAEQQVTAVHVDSFYRPHAKLARRRKPSQHAYGLAADLFGFTLADGRTLVVERDFHGALGTPVCGPDARVTEPAEDAATLRNLVCHVAGARLFNHMLTPNYNTAHRNHLHFDIKRDDKQVVIE